MAAEDVPSLGMLVDRTSFDETDSFGIDSMPLPWNEDEASNKYAVMRNGRIKRRLRWRPKVKKTAPSSNESISPSVSSKTTLSNHSLASTETVKKANKGGSRRSFFSSRPLQQIPESKSESEPPVSISTGIVTSDKDTLFTSADVEVQAGEVVTPTAKNKTPTKKTSFPLFRRKRDDTNSTEGSESDLDTSMEHLPSLENDMHRRVDLRLPEEEVPSSNQSVRSTSSRYRIQPPPENMKGAEMPFLIESLEYIPEEGEEDALSPLPSFENESRFPMNDYDDLSTILSKSSDSNPSCPVDIDNATFHEAEKNLKAIHQMGAEHLKYREYDEALEVFEEILRSQLTRYGPWHPRVGTALHNIGIVHMKKGDINKAIKSCREAILVRKKVLGEYHMDVADSLSQLGVSYLEGRKNAKAVEVFREALKIRRKCVGQKHPKIAKILNNIGCALFEMNELEVANIAFEEALSVQRNALASLAAESAEISDQSLLSIACTLSNIGSIQLYWRNFEKATKALEEALMIQQSVLGDQHPLSRRTMESLEWISDIDVESCDTTAKSSTASNVDEKEIVRSVDISKTVTGLIERQLEIFRAGLESTCGSTYPTCDDDGTVFSENTNRVMI